MTLPYRTITLKPGHEIHLKNKHHAIFRPAVLFMPDIPNGSIVEVTDNKNQFLCYATWNKEAYICGRVISFEKGDPLKSIRASMEKAINLRTAFFAKEDTNAYRLINAEGDSIPGIIVDRYGDVLVMQLTTMGMDSLREWVADQLIEITGIKGVFEKSTGPARKKEGLEPVEQWVRKGASGDVIIKERGLKYRITLEGSQKTGLFLDQREMRSLVRDLAKDKIVLDCCSYVAGFSLNALAGGANRADAIDYDAEALERAKENMQLNNIAPSHFGAHAQDVFDGMRATKKNHYNFIVLDPPAFAKRSSDIDQAKKAYTDLNRMAMELLPANGLLLTCSCSYQVDQALFQTIVFHAARQAKRNVRILQRHRQAFDHPINLFHPEVDYLKSLLLWVE